MTSFKTSEQGDIRTERIFNLFLFVEHGLIANYGAKYHKMTGTERHKLAYLQSRVEDDVLQSRRFPIPKFFVLVDSATGTRREGAIHLDLLQELVAGGRNLAIFEEAFEAMNAPRDPLFCITPVVDGIVTVDGVALLNILNPGNDPSPLETKEPSHE